MRPPLPCLFFTHLLLVFVVCFFLLSLLSLEEFLELGFFDCTFNPAEGSMSRHEWTS
jgi:hypothetical protein